MVTEANKLKKADIFNKNVEYKQESLKVRKARETRLRSQQLVTLPEGLSFDSDSKTYLKTLYEAGVASKHKLHELQLCLDMHNAFFKKGSAADKEEEHEINIVMPENDRDKAARRISNKGAKS